MDSSVCLYGICIFVVVFPFSNSMVCSNQEFNKTETCTSNLLNKNDQMKPSSEWVTRIHHCVNSLDKYIQFCFTPAPQNFMFHSYDVALLKITENEGLATEIEEYVYSSTIKQTYYKFDELTKGRYRISVSLSDNGMTCQNNFNIPVPCMKTVTGIIEIQTDHTDQSYDSSSTTYKSIWMTEGNHTLVRTVTRSNEQEPNMHNKNLENSYTTKSTPYISKAEDYVNRSPKTVNYRSKQTSAITVIAIAVTCGSLSFALVTTAAVLWYKLQRKKKNRTAADTVNEKIVAIISAEDDIIHEHVVSTFATCLQKYCRCKVFYYPWSVDKDMFNWISNTLDKSDFNMFVISERALGQYNDWKHKMSSPHGGTFIPYLSRVLNRFANSPFYSQKLIFVTFEHSRNVKMPPELCTSQYRLMDDWTQLLSHIHGCQNYLQMKNYSFSMNLKNRKEGIVFKDAIKAAIKKSTHTKSAFNGHNATKLEVEQIDVSIQQASENCLINYSSLDVNSEYYIDDLSLGTAVTIAEGEAGGFSNARLVLEYPQQHSRLHCMDKYGICMQPNIPEPRAIDHDMANSESENIGCFEFIPPEPSLLDDDINSQHQYELMRSINDNYLQRLENETDTEHTS